MQAPARPSRIDPLICYGALYVLFLYLPILLIPLFSFHDSIYIAFPIDGFTLKWYRGLLHRPALIGALYNSVEVAVAVAVVSTTLGTLAATAMTRFDLRGRGLVVAFIMLPFAIPGIILGISLLVLFNHLGLELSLFTVTLAHVAIAVPISVMVMLSRMEGFDRSLEEASMDLGESVWSTFWRVTFPLVLPGIISSLLLTFTVSFDEFLLAFFLTGNEPTLPIYIYGQLRYPQELPSVLALGSCILVASTIALVAAEMIRRRGIRLEGNPDVPS